MATNADLQDRVLAALDEVTPQGSEPSVPADILGDELIGAASDVLLEAAPTLVLPAAVDEGPLSATETDYGAQLVLLPEDFLRVLQVRFAGWNTVIPERDLLDSQSDSYRQVRIAARNTVEHFIEHQLPDHIHDPTPGRLLVDADRPVATLVFTSVLDENTNVKRGRHAIEGYPRTDPDGPLSPQAEQLLIVKHPEQPNEVPDGLIDPLVWKSAARVASAFLRDYAVATACTEQYRQSLGRRELMHDRLNQDEERATITQRPYRFV